MFYFKSQKQYFTLLVAVFFSTMCFGQKRFVKQPQADQRISLNLSKVETIDSDSKLANLVDEFYGVTKRIANLSEKHSLLLDLESVNKTIKEFDLPKEVLSFKSIRNMTRKDLTLFCKKFPEEALFIKNELKKAHRIALSSKK